MYTIIKYWCDEQHITVRKMCSDLGIPEQTISNLKRRQNQKSLSAESVAKIADYMGISALELIQKSKISQ